MGLTLIELNEINFDVVQQYLDAGYDLPTFRSLLSRKVLTTTSEEVYEHIEPWIQWPTVHTGLKYSEHGIFRLGDMVYSDLPQIFEQVENVGKRVLAVSPMNAVNRINGCFIPDPWTATNADSSYSSRWLHQALVQSVNDNAQSKISKQTYLKLAAALISVLPTSQVIRLGKKVKYGVSKKWRKAIFLDLLLSEIFISKMKNNNPDFGCIFLNAGAHIQHHYFHASTVIKSDYRNPYWYIEAGLDPLLEVLQTYDAQLSRIIRHSTDFILCTGLQQIPYSNPKYYYRLKDHAKFLAKRGLRFSNVQPRMTRDFLIEFEGVEDLEACQRYLENMFVAETRLFSSIERRNRQLFVTLDYEHELTENTQVIEPINCQDKIVEDVTFVALKNGHHDAKGYLITSPGAERYLPNKENIELAEIHDVLQGYFDIKNVH